MQNADQITRPHAKYKETPLQEVVVASDISVRQLIHYSRAAIFVKPVN